MRLQVSNSMLAPQLNSSDSLHSILHKSAGFKNGSKTQDIYWDASHYHLGHSQIFHELSESKRQEVLKSLNNWSLSLSYYIEKFGLNYGAQMILLAESTEEKSLYSLFTADEVRHRLWIEQYIPGNIPQDIDFHPLLKALALALQQGTKEAMVFTIQVVLEGFGLAHYSYLKDSCLSPDLQAVFTNILKDEANHHGMGVVLVQRMQLDQQTKEQIEDLTVMFVRALIEAEWVAKAVSLQCDGLSAGQRQQLLVEINWQQQIHQRIEKLKQLLRKVGYDQFVERLESKGAFRY